MMKLTTGWTNSDCSFNTVVKPVVNRFDNRLDNRLDVCLHDTTGCQTGCTNLLSKRFDNRVNVCIHDTTGCQTGLTTGCIVYINIQPVVKPVWQPLWQPAVYTIQPVGITMFLPWLSAFWFEVRELKEYVSFSLAMRSHQKVYIKWLALTSLS